MTTREGTLDRGRSREGRISRLLPFFDRSYLVFGGVAVGLLILVLNPLFQLLHQSLQDPDTGALTLANYVGAFANLRHLLAIWHSIQLGLVVAGLCVAFGVPMAWAVAQTNMPGKALVSALVLVAFITQIGRASCRERV